MRLTVLLTLVLAANVHASDDESVLQGLVKGQTLTSPELPGVSLDFAKFLTYAGGQRFNLYGVATAEQHFFVETGQEGTIRRFYWVQFEHYLATNEHRYKYKAERVARVGDLDFIVDTSVFAHYFGKESNPASDSAKAKAFFTAKGYRMPDAIVRARCFYLPDSSNRSELMIIYGEALSQADLDGAAIPAEELADVKYPQLAAKVIEHVNRGVSIHGR
jgi:hypothetical protein